MKRGGKLYRQDFARGIKQNELTEKGRAKDSGTTVHFKPDHEIFIPKVDVRQGGWCAYW